jgi:hypothetical protein
MSIIGFLISLGAALFMCIGLIPILGWLNWFTTFPLAVLGAIFCSIAYSHRRSGLAVAGLTICGAAFLVGLIRVIIGCGIFKT